MSYSWYNATAIATRTSWESGDNSSILHTMLVTLGVLIVFGILDNINPFWNALGLQSRPENYEPLEPQDYITIESDQEASDETSLPMMPPTVPRRNPRGRGCRKAQDEQPPMTPTTLRRSSRVREREARNGLLTPVSTPTTPMRSAKAKGKGKTKSIKNKSIDDFFEPVPNPTGQRKVIKGREKQIVLDEYEAFMNEPEEKKVEKSSEDDFDYEGYSTPWTATQRKNVSKGSSKRPQKERRRRAKLSLMD
ncbi:uncharacterized protein EAF02_001326 [Botrytis sinoallii]|uniref:uncharacterized protein n=1 Tax=Botrytis sinoallii TaxID=1463999 RepID=UPI00190078C1|nr:uncharacterized protein EAF02_001326 [Botrytis sinoallii]KAF7891001.1 hypothetical protein EAF02_001326 [Botrytis sinoallii]